MFDQAVGFRLEDAVNVSGSKYSVMELTLINSRAKSLKLFCVVSFCRSIRTILYLVILVELYFLTYHRTSFLALNNLFTYNGEKYVKVKV